LTKDQTFSKSFQPWITMIEEAEASELGVQEWLIQHNITKNSYYYWKKKLSSLGFLPTDSNTHIEDTSFVQLPIAAPTERQSGYEPAAVIRTHKFDIEISGSASPDFIDSIGRLIRYAV